MKNKLLSSLSLDSGSLLCRDGSFSSLGHCVEKKEKNLLSFIDEEVYLDTVNNNKNISSIICTPSLEKKLTSNIGLITSENPRLTFFQIHNSLAPSSNSAKKPSIIHDSSSINSKYVSKFDVEIGMNSFVDQNVVIHPGVRIGNDVHISSGCVIGGDGFEYKRYGNYILQVMSKNLIFTHLQNSFHSSIFHHLKISKLN